MVDADSREPISFLVPRSPCVQARSTRGSPAWPPRRSRRMGNGRLWHDGDFNCPSYNADLRDVGFASGAEELRRWLEAADAFVISSPEYTASLPGPVKATPERWPR
jgi:hypothetical protein